MNYKTQGKYLESDAFPEIKRALLDMRGKKLLKGHYINTRAVSSFIFDNPNKYRKISTKGRKHVHECIGTFITEKIKGGIPYNNRAHGCGGRTYFIPGGVESI